MVAKRNIPVKKQGNKKRPPKNSKTAKKTSGQKSNRKNRKNSRLTQIVSYFLLISLLFYGLFQATTTLHLDKPIEYTIKGRYNLLDDQQLKQLLEKESDNKGYLLLDTNHLTQKLQDLKIYKKVKIEKSSYRKVTVFLEEKGLMIKQKQSTGEVVTFDENGEEIQLALPTHIPVADTAMAKEDVKKIAAAFSKQSPLLLQEFSEITYAFVGEFRKEVKITTVSGDLIFIKIEDIEKKLPNFLEIDTLMNKKKILRCEYHFEYTDANVVVKEIK